MPKQAQVDSLGLVTRKIKHKALTHRLLAINIFIPMSFLAYLNITKKTRCKFCHIHCYLPIDYKLHSLHVVFEVGLHEINVFTHALSLRAADFAVIVSLLNLFALNA